MRAIRPGLGAAFCISRLPRRRAGARRLRGLRAHLEPVGRLQQLHQRAELRVAQHDVLQQLQALAADHHEPAPDRPLRVLVGEDRRPEVVDPRGPEQEALVAVARRVVGERVEQLVDDLERRHEVRLQRREVLERRAQLLDGRARGAHERADLVADHRRRLAQERARLLERRPERPRARAQGLERRSELVGERLGLAERAVRRGQRRRELLQRGAQVRVLLGQHGEHGVGAVDELRELVVLGAQLVDDEREVVDDATDVPAPLRELAGDLAGVTRRRLEAADRVRERAPVAAERLPAVGQQQLQVRARVAVERREDLVQVDVRQRLPDRDPLPVLQLTGLRRAGRELGDHVLQAGLRAQEHARVLVDRDRVLLELERDDRLAALEPHARDLADLDAGDVDGLALARRDRLGARQLGVDLGEVLAEDRHPARQREPLVGEDHRRDGERDDDQADDRQEVDEVLADRAHPASFRVPNGRIRLRSCWSSSVCTAVVLRLPTIGSVLAAAGPLRSGRFWR